MRTIIKLMLAVMVVAWSADARALNILLTNDDGLTSNVKALYEALKADGHDVIVAVPCQGQSGMGAAVKFARPLGPIATDCLNGAARAGDPGAGPMTKAGFGTDWHYVDGTPVMATLYGMDVLAAARWNKLPDLVLSGPNEGQNVGAIVISSGTVSNVQYALARGVPAIALSAGVNTTDNPGLANPRSVEVARRSVDLLRTLRARVTTVRLLPPGLALNVNFPDALVGATWQASRIGTFDRYLVRFTTDMSQSPLARASGAARALPGVAFDMNEVPASPSQQQDEAHVSLTAISVSPMQLGYEPNRRAESWVRKIVGDVRRGTAAVRK